MARIFFDRERCKMAVSKIVRHFEGLGRAYIDMRDVTSEFRRLMPNETIRVTGVDLPSDILRGAHYSYIHRPSIESALLDTKVTQIIYSLQQPIEWQRLVVCKELVHVFDDTGIETDQPTEVIELVKQLSGEIPKSIKTGGLHWFFDGLAEYQAMAILFPFGLREAINGKGQTVDKDRIAYELELPVRVVDFVLSDAWKSLRESML